MTDPRAFTAADAASVLRRPTASDDKYSRGVLGVRTGSTRYPGAAVLGVEAAWRTGIGMVRYIGPDLPTHLILARRPETVAASGRVQAWLIGSGTDAAGRGADETAALREILSGEIPVVVDAGALDLAIGAAAPVLVTPHAGEHARLRAAIELPEEDDREVAARQTASALGATVLLKGAPTIVATPSGWVRSIPAQTHWLATAGTGDVLGGIVGALAASQAGARTVGVEALGPIAAAGGHLHQAAAVAAAAARRGGPITALDIAERVAEVVGGLIAAP